MGDAGRGGNLDAPADMAGFNPGQVHHHTNIFEGETLQQFGLSLDRDFDFLGGDSEIAHILGRRHSQHWQIEKGALHRGLDRGGNGRNLLLNGEGDGKPNQDRKHQREKLEPKVLKNQLPKERDHLATWVPAVLVGASVLPTPTGPGFTRWVVQERSQPIQLRERAGRTRTEVRKARNSSKVTPRTNCPLYA